jgi:hypothetical protein
MKTNKEQRTNRCTTISHSSRCEKSVSMTLATEMTDRNMKPLFIALALFGVFLVVVVVATSSKTVECP